MSSCFRTKALLSNNVLKRHILRLRKFDDIRGMKSQNCYLMECCLQDKFEGALDIQVYTQGTLVKVL